jgi:hypothetical protein
MAGGLLQLVSEGQQNIILNGNPHKSFFKSKYAQYTNFSLQKFVLNYEGSKTMGLTEDSTFTFKIKRYADLLMDCYLSVELPTIWSPILPPQYDTETQTYTPWAPYEFRWIKNIGTLMIRQIQITCGNQLLQQYSGQYLLSAVQRDFSKEKRELFDKMIGNILELNDPANSGARVNAYPNSFYTPALAGPEPSIRGRTLYIPLNSWFGLNSKMAFPLVALQYNELQITITMRPINELFQIRDVYDAINGFPYVAPNFNLFYMQMYRFLQPPPDIPIGNGSYIDTRSIWNANIHLNCTYGFLSNNESRYFALNQQDYLFRQVYERVFYNITGPNKVEVNSLGMVANYMFFFQRSDVNLRNEWSNYNNWPYDYEPNNVVLAPSDGATIVSTSNGDAYIGAGVNADGTLTGLFLTQDYSPQNALEILTNLAILYDGEYRENEQPSGVYNYVEKYIRTQGNAPDGLYVYNFCLDTSPFNVNPSGACNMSRFNKIEFEFNTIIPPINQQAQTLAVCNPDTGEIIGVNKTNWNIYEYNFNLVVFEERINMVVFTGGNAGLMYAT